MRRVSLRIPDRFYDAIAREAGKVDRSVPNYFLHAARVMVNKRGLKLPPVDKMRQQDARLEEIRQQEAEHSERSSDTTNEASMRERPVAGAGKASQE